MRHFFWGAVMWRREVIRVVLAANWIVFAIASNMLIAHGYLQGMNCRQMAREDIPFPEDEKADVRLVEEAQEERNRQYRLRTQPVFEFGQRGWFVACGASLGTAVLLMIAFPKKPEA